MTKPHPLREQAVKDYLAGVKKTQIHRTYNISMPALDRAIQHYRLYNNFADAPRSGRPRKYDHEALLHKLRDRLRRKKHMKRAVEKAWERLPLKQLQKAMDSWPKRLKKCIKAKGGRFE
jgi:hypothetical protein